MIRGQLTMWIIEPDFYMSFNIAIFLVTVNINLFSIVIEKEGGPEIRSE